MVIKLLVVARIVMGIVFVVWALAARAIRDSKIRRHRSRRSQRRGGMFRAASVAAHE